MAGQPLRVPLARLGPGRVGTGAGAGRGVILDVPGADRSPIVGTGMPARRRDCPMAPPPHTSDAQPMHCMEIRGGSQAVEETVATPGLEARLYSQPHEGDPSGGDVHYVSLCGGGVITRLI